MLQRRKPVFELIIPSQRLDGLYRQQIEFRHKVGIRKKQLPLFILLADGLFERINHQHVLPLQGLRPLSRHILRGICGLQVKQTAESAVFGQIILDILLLIKTAAQNVELCGILQRQLRILCQGFFVYREETGILLYGLYPRGLPPPLEYFPGHELPHRMRAVLHSKIIGHRVQFGAAETRYHCRFVTFQTLANHLRSLLPAYFHNRRLGLVVMERQQQPARSFQYYLEWSIHDAKLG